MCGSQEERWSGEGQDRGRDKEVVHRTVLLCPKEINYNDILTA